MGQQRHLRTVRHHSPLCHHRHHPQPARFPLPHAKAPAYRGIHEEACLHDNGHHHHHLRHHHGRSARHARPELLHHGQRPAYRVCLATGSHPHLTAAARQRQPDQECLPHLCTPGSHRVHRHRLPHHSHSQRTRQPAATSRPARMYVMAMDSHQAPQPQRAPLRHVLHLHLTNGVHRLRLSLMVGLHTLQRTAAHLVDYATHLYTDHHLRQPLCPSVRRTPRTGGRSNHEELVLRSSVYGCPAGDGCLVSHAKHLLGCRHIQPKRPLHTAVPA